MTMQPGQVIGTLKTLYETCQDVENGYRNAATIFHTCAEQRAD